MGDPAEKAERLVACMRRRYRLEARPTADGSGQTAWMVLDRTNSGSGVYGDEIAGRSNYEKHIMFRALEALDHKHDWHEYDWHTLTGTAENRVRQMLAWRTEQEAAAREVAGIRALVHLMVHRARRECRS
jgi:hypothetical protein